ncbi:MAG: FAD-dependent oxidoreductase [Chloroflexi bacterium]|nr:FAD-dependent oxidoreductase [Chloroflexota bacterium]
MSRRALVIGGNIEGVQAALDLADAGIEVTLVEESPALHPTSTAGSQPASEAATLRYIPKILRAASHRNINVVTSADVLQVKGKRGNFKATILKQPGYVNSDLCTSCGRCERECPVNISLQPDGLNAHKAIHLPAFGLKSQPSAYTLEKNGVAPCTAACPAGINVQGYVALVSKGKFAEALDLVTEAVPFPRVLGRICTRPCESKCTRGKIDQPVSICDLKRFIADNNSTGFSLRRAQTSNGARKPVGPPRVAIIGGGPAGLTAARDLARLGHKSTVFEALPVAGGMIAVGMPRFRLPREVRMADINDIVKLGIEIRTSTPIGKDLTLADLRKQGYEAILITTGAHTNQRLNVPGETLSGVINGVNFLKALNLKQPVTIGRRVAVIGGGYTAVDSARAAIRLGCENVSILYRRSLEEMPADPEEVAEAQEEGVKIEYLVAPVRIHGSDGAVTGIECTRMRLGEPDKSGRRTPIPIEGSEFVMDVDTVIVAVGQRPDLSFLEGDSTLTEGKRHVVVDPLTMTTGVPGVFAAGDATGRPGPLINAIAAGRRAAVSIDAYLRGEQITERQGKLTPVEVDLQQTYIPPVERQQMPLLRYKDRVGNFEEVELGFDAEMAVKEAKRCLNCAGCSTCLECQRACELRAIDHSAKAEMVELDVEAIIATENPVPKHASVKLKDDSGESQPVNRRPGIYWIPPSPETGVLSEASAVAARVMVDMAVRSADTGEVKRETRKAPAELEVVLGNRETKIGVCVCCCGGSISEVVNIRETVSYCKGLEGVVYCGEIGYACTSDAAIEIKKVAKEQNLTHVVLAACSCCNLDQICFSCSDRRVRCKQNLLNSKEADGISYEFVNIREHCAWAHRSRPDKATSKAISLIAAGVARARQSQPHRKRTLGLGKGILVLGRGLSGMQAAADMAAQGFETILVNSHFELPCEGSLCQADTLKRYLQKELAKKGATVLYGAQVASLSVTAGGYNATVIQGEKEHSFRAGVVILDISELYGRTSKLPVFLQKAIRNGYEKLLSEPAGSRLPGIFLCGTGEATEDTVEAVIQGSAAASKASILLNSGEMEIVETIAAVDRMRCRGCGTCESVCPFLAIKVSEQEKGVKIAEVDEGLCRGCGLCVANCPSGALSQYDNTDAQITASLEAISSEPECRSINESNLDFEPRIVGFVCNWSAYTGVELAGLHGTEYPASIKLVRLPCLGRVHLGLVLKAFQLGTDGVMLLGCPPKECHYDEGMTRAMELFEQAGKMLHLLGIEPGRLSLIEVPLGGDEVFTRQVSDFAKRIRKTNSTPASLNNDMVKPKA